MSCLLDNPYAPFLARFNHALKDKAEFDTDIGFVIPKLGITVTKEAFD